MSKIIPFPGVRRPVFSCVDGASDGLFVLHTDECGHKETFGPFPDPSEAREFAANISAQANIPVDWETFPQPYVPDPRNGEVYATNYTNLAGAMAFRDTCLRRPDTRRVEVVVVIDETTPHHHQQEEIDNIRAFRATSDTEGRS